MRERRTGGIQYPVQGSELVKVAVFLEERIFAKALDLDWDTRSRIRTAWQAERADLCHEAMSKE